MGARVGPPNQVWGTRKSEFPGVGLDARYGVTIFLHNLRVADRGTSEGRCDRVSLEACLCRGSGIHSSTSIDILK